MVRPSAYPSDFYPGQIYPGQIPPSTTIPPLASTVLRINLVPNPSMRSSAANWTMSGGSAFARVALAGTTSGWGEQVTCNGVGVNPVAYSDSFTVSALSTYVFWCKAVCSASTTAFVSVQWYNGSSVLISTLTGAVTGISGVLGVFSASGAAPAGAVTAKVGLVLSGTPANGVTFNAGEWMGELGTTIRSWFDGDVSNAVWLGTQYDSSSELYLVGTNPAMPVMDVRAWAGINPTPQGVPTAQPSIISDRVKAFKVQRGRQFELGQDETGEGTLSCNNSDGAVTGGTNGCNVMTPVQVSATWAGIRYPIFTGFVRNWPRHDDNASVAWADLELVDLFEAWAQRKLLGQTTEVIAAETPPDMWFPMNEPQTSSSIGNLISGQPSAPLVSSNAGSIPFALGGQSPFAGVSDSVLTLANSTGATGKASQYQVVGPQNKNGYSVTFTAGGKWAVGCFVRMTGGASVIWSALDVDGTVMAELSVSITSNSVGLYARQGGSGGSLASCGSTLAPGSINNGMFVYAGWNGTNLFCDIFGIDNFGNEWEVQATTTPTSPLVGTSRWIAWGCAFKANGTIYGSSNADMQMCHGLMWTTSANVPDENGTPINDVAYMGLAAWFQASTINNLTRLLTWVGVTTLRTSSTDPPDSMFLGMLRDTTGQSELDALRNVTLDRLGRIFIDKTGYPAYQSLHHQMGTATKWTIGGNTAGGEYPYTGSPDFNYDPTYVFNDVQVQRPGQRGVIPVWSRGSALARVENQPSQGQYFQRVLQVDSNVFSDADALDMANYLCNLYQQPSLRVATVRFEPSANPGLWPFVLGAELGDTVQLNHRAIGKPTVSLLLSIQQIHHEIDADAGTWVTEIELTPWHSDWVLGAMHTTLVNSITPGATSITLNPIADSSYNPAEASLGVGAPLALGTGTVNLENVTITSVLSQPTPGATGYTSVVVGITACTKSHTAGDLVTDPLPSWTNQPAIFDPWSILDSTTRVGI